jgi:hypothetical protein
MNIVSMIHRILGETIAYGLSLVLMFAGRMIV